jgi:nuclear pore complex protein Nup93
MSDTGHADMLTDIARLTTDSGFSDLLRSAEQLSAAVEGNEELPQVERNLRQLLEASNELWSRVTQTSTQDNEAQA